MNKFLSFIKKMFSKNKKGLPNPYKETVEKVSSNLDDIKFTPPPTCIKESTEVFKEDEKNFIRSHKIYNNGDVYSNQVGDASTDPSFSHFAFKISSENYNENSQTSVDFRYNNSREYFSGNTPYRIILTYNASEEDVKKIDESCKFDMQLKELYFEKEQDENGEYIADGKYILSSVIKTYGKSHSENGRILVNGSNSPCYIPGATIQLASNNKVFTYEQIIEIINNLKMPHRLPEDIESIIEGDYQKTVKNDPDKNKDSK